jgi:hypothetical protein
MTAILTREQIDAFIAAGFLRIDAFPRDTAEAVRRTDVVSIF